MRERDEWTTEDRGGVGTGTRDAMGFASVKQTQVPLGILGTAQGRWSAARSEV